MNGQGSLSTFVTKKAICHMDDRITCLPPPGRWALELAGGREDKK